MNNRDKIQQALAKFLTVRAQRFLLVILLAGLLIAGLHPFTFFPHNQVSWLTGTRGVRFHGYGEVVGGSPFGRSGRSVRNDAGPEATVELWVTSGDTSEYVKDIVSIYSRDREPFAIEQWGTRLIVGGWFRDRQANRRFQHIGINNVFTKGIRRFVTVTSGPDGTRIFLEGVLQDNSPGLVLGAENFDGSLLLGQTATARQEWHGDILGLAFYKKEFTPDEVAKSYAAWQRNDLQELRASSLESVIYPFGEGRGNFVGEFGNPGDRLVVPDRLSAIDPSILAIPSRQDLANVSDVTLNILGFIPLGLLLVIYARSSGQSNRRAIITAVLVGFLVSLIIELLQVLLPTRDSSLLDLINNTVGSGIGAGLGAAMWPRLKKIRGLAI